MSDLSKLLTELNSKKMDPVKREKLRLDLLRAQGPKKDMSTLTRRSMINDLNADRWHGYQLDIVAERDGDALVYDAATGKIVGRTIDPTTTSGDLIVLYGTDTTNYAASSLGAVATASSEYDPTNHGAAFAIDSNDATFWASYNESPVGTWIYIDMGFPITIGRFRIKQDTSDIIYKIQHSADHLAWTDVYQSTTFDTEQTGTFTEATARYWRFLGVSATVPAWNIFTIELYSPAGVHTLVPLHTVANPGWALRIGTDGFPAYLADPAPQAHKTSHENGGADEISVAGLSGELADAQTPKAHNQSATTVTVADSADYFTGTEVETILAEMALGWAKLARANTFTLPQTIAGSTDAVQSVIKGVSGQTADLAQWKTSVGTVNTRVTAGGDVISTSRLEGQSYDYPLRDATNGSHFLMNAAGTPTGWTAATAGYICDTNRRYSYWTLGAASTARTFKYRKQSGITIEGLPANQARTFQWGDVRFRDGRYTCDIIYTFGVYADNAGAIDETKYNKVSVKWDAATLAWYVWSEMCNGTTAYVSDGLALSYPLNPINLRSTIYNDTNKTLRAFVGPEYYYLSHTMLFSTASISTTWGNVWLQVECSRGVAGGVGDVIQINSIDTFAE